MSVEHVRLSQLAKDQLLKLKRATGISNWNVLCRWAFAVSLADPSPPSPTKIPADSSVEMTWKVFGGAYHEIYRALLTERCVEDGLEPTDEVLSAQLRLHLHRGIGSLAAARDIRTIAGFIGRAERASNEDHSGGSGPT